MTNQLESVPTQWTAADDDFFGLVAGLFDPAFLYGAGVLLATYDMTEACDEPVTQVTTDTRASHGGRDALINTRSA